MGLLNGALVEQSLVQMGSMQTCASVLMRNTCLEEESLMVRRQESKLGGLTGATIRRMPRCFPVIHKELYNS